MPSNPLEQAVRHIRAFAGPADTDPDLLTHYVGHGDEDSFAALVARHGPAVMGVCRRVLGERQAAEDAFQATFLVLAKRAAAIRNPGAVAAWLHGVAFRIASKHKGKLARLPRTGEHAEPPVKGDDVSWREVRRVLDEEVNRLPMRLRFPVLLCYLDGMTRDEAAAALGLKVSTLRGRLEDGRERLRTRLAQRGVELSAALLAVSAARTGTAIGESLIASTLATASGPVSKTIATLADGAAATAVAGKAKWLFAGLVLTAITVGTTTTTYTGAAGQTAGKPSTPIAKDEPPAKPNEADWGEAGGDFQLRLQKTAAVELGKFPELVCDLKNVGREKRSVHGIAEFAEVEVDGLWYTSVREGSFGGRTIELAAGGIQSPWLTIRPNGEWIHLKPQENPDRNREAVPLRLPLGKHKVRVAKRMSEKERVVSNAIEVEIVSVPADWGPATDGLRARIRLSKSQFTAFEPLEFDLDLKNVSAGEKTVKQSPDLCAIWFDGVPYLKAVDESRVVSMKLKPNAEYRAFVSASATQRNYWYAFTRGLSEEKIKQLKGKETLMLTPGKHTIEVMYLVADGKGPASQKVEFLVEPGNWGEAVQGIRSRIRLGKTKLVEGDPLAFDLDLLNVSPGPTNFDAFPTICELEVDGVRYRPTEVYTVAPVRKDIYPDEICAGFLSLTADATWKADLTDEKIKKPGSEYLQLTRGRHQVRVHCKLLDKIVPVSQTLTIEVAPRKIDAAVAELARNADQIRVVLADNGKSREAAPTRIVKGPLGDVYARESFDHRPLSDAEAKGAAIEFWEGTNDGADPVRRRPEYRMSYRAEAVEGIREAFLPRFSGKAVDGLEIAARLRRATVSLGEPIVIEVTIRNATTARVIKQHRMNSYDYWPETTFEVSAPGDGGTWTITKPIGIMTKSDKAHDVTLQPGDTYTQVMRLDQWRYRRPADKDTRPAPTNLFTKPGKYAITCRYSGHLAEVDKSVGPLASEPVRLTIEHPESWGKVTGGFQSRVRLKKPRFEAGEALAFDLDLRNLNDTEFFGGERSPEACTVYIDDVAYAYSPRVIGSIPPLVQMQPKQELAPFVSVVADGRWTATGNQPLTLSAGKHKLQVGYQLGELVKSQALEFEVKPGWGPAAEGIHLRVRPTTEKFREGDPLQFVLDLRNEGKADFSEAPVPYECEIEWDGKIYRYSGPIGFTSKIITIPPKGQHPDWVSVTTDRLWVRTERQVAADGSVTHQSVPLELTPGKHTLRVAYQMTTPNKMKPVSAIADVVVEAKSDRPHVRLKAEMAQWKAGESPKLAVELANDAKGWFYAPRTDRNCLLEVDGQWYENESGRPSIDPRKDPILDPSMPWARWFEVPLDKPTSGGAWVLLVPDDPIRPVPESRKLRLTPGKHKVRIAYFVQQAAKGKADSPEEIRIESPPMEIEILEK